MENITTFCKSDLFFHHTNAFFYITFWVNKSCNTIYGYYMTCKYHTKIVARCPFSGEIISVTSGSPGITTSPDSRSSYSKGQPLPSFCSDWLITICQSQTHLVHDFSIIRQYKPKHFLTIIQFPL